MDYRHPRMQLQDHDALIVVDVQRDFLPGGSLAVPDGDAVVPVLNVCIRQFARAGLPVYATRDWHPPDHCSFVGQGGPWPPHCVSDSAGAEFAMDLELPDDARIVSKATSPHSDAYSGFDGTDLAAELKAAGVSRVFIGGLATDYCVLATVRDARRYGFDVIVLRDAIRAVGVADDDEAKALSAMRAEGAELAASTQLDPHA